MFGPHLDEQPVQTYRNDLMLIYPGLAGLAFAFALILILPASGALGGVGTISAVLIAGAALALVLAFSVVRLDAFEDRLLIRRPGGRTETIYYQQIESIRLRSRIGCRIRAAGWPMGVWFPAAFWAGQPDERAHLGNLLDARLDELLDFIASKAELEREPAYFPEFVYFSSPRQQPDLLPESPCQPGEQPLAFYRNLTFEARYPVLSILLSLAWLALILSLAILDSSRSGAINWAALIMVFTLWGLGWIYQHWRHSARTLRYLCACEDGLLLAYSFRQQRLSWQDLLSMKFERGLCRITVAGLSDNLTFSAPGGRAGSRERQHLNHLIALMLSRAGLQPLYDYQDGLTIYRRP